MAETTEELLERVAVKLLKPLVDTLADKADKQLITIDRDTLRRQLSMTKSYFNEHMVNQPRLMAIQHRAPTDGDTDSRKVYYPADEAKRVCLEILAEWPH
jgi:hypothetical protein